MGDARWTVYKQPNGHPKMDRYDGIQPFIQNRIKLRVPEHTSDYVNASPITLISPSDPSQPPLRYIAMQGPTEASIDHVWRMVAEQTSSPAVIMQITSMVEFTTSMGTYYYPENKEPWNINESNLWGDDWRATLSVVSSEIGNDGTETCKLLLHVHGEEEPRVVWHLLYKNWDNRSPFSLDDLGSFMEVIKRSRQYNAPSSPRIIHCNAGVGRTSVFIALEHLIRELSLGALVSYNLPQEGPDLVYDTVESLRQQRHSMVQSESQYLFIYQAMRKLWDEKYGVVYGEDYGDEPAT